MFSFVVSIEFYDFSIYTNSLYYFIKFMLLDLFLDIDLSLC